MLDDLNKIKNIDKSNVLDSVKLLPSQCEEAYQLAKKIDIDPSYRNIENILFCGMGGSGLGARVIESVYNDSISVPVVRLNDYNIPSFVNEKTLVFCSSYSGNTEETLNNFRQASDKKAKMLVISAGGELINLAQQNNIPYYKIEPKSNPSNQPRMAIGYSVIGQLTMLSLLGIVKFDVNEINNITSSMNEIGNLNKFDVKTHDNPAKTMACEFKNKIVIFASAEHLKGAAHVFNNQLNENAKNFSSDFVIPELNHHLMEGLNNPSENSKNLHFIFINSNLYSKDIKKRLDITKEVVGKNDIFYSDFSASSESKIAQVFELIQFGAYVGFYLSMLYGQDPAPIPWVDYFKSKLK